MKWHRYNFIENINDNEYILFNCSTNKLMYITENVKKLIVDNIANVFRIKAIHSDLYYLLKRNEFIIDDHFDEIKDAIIRMQNNPEYSKYFELIINPTLDCNLKCWYCYESHQKNSSVNNETMQSIMIFIKNKVESKELKEILITFFGGEPLLKFDEVIWPILGFTQKLCERNKKKLTVCFITNALLLSSKIVDKLFETGLFCTFQVPFDGNEAYHNKIKRYANGKGTFNIIIHNVMYALEQGNRVIIRCNYTSENINSFDELISLFNKYAAECIEHDQLTFSYHKVWQEKETEGMKTIVDKFEEKTNVIDLSFDTCYADRKNSVVLNFNGDVYSCTARDFKPGNREGHLNRDGKIIFNEKYQKRMEARLFNKNCQNCIILPICNICSQVRLENQNEEVKCLRFLSEEDKIRILLKKMQIVNNSKKNEKGLEV